MQVPVAKVYQGKTLSCNFARDVTQCGNASKLSHGLTSGFWAWGTLSRRIRTNHQLLKNTMYHYLLKCVCVWGGGGGGEGGTAW